MSVDWCTVQNTVLRNMCAHVQVHTSKQSTKEGTGGEGEGKEHEGKKWKGKGKDK